MSCGSKGQNVKISVSEGDTKQSPLGCTHQSSKASKELVDTVHWCCAQKRAQTEGAAQGRFLYYWSLHRCGCQPLAPPGCRSRRSQAGLFCPKWHNLLHTKVMSEHVCWTKKPQLKFAPLLFELLHALFVQILIKTFLVITRVQTTKLLFSGHTKLSFLRFKHPLYHSLILIIGVVMLFHYFWLLYLKFLIVSKNKKPLSVPSSIHNFPPVPLHFC